MPTHKNDEDFETYLRDFQPLPPDPLPDRATRSVLSRFSFHRAIYAAAAALLVATAALMLFKMLRSREPQVTEKISVQSTPSAPLTLQRANALLAGAASYSAAIDSLAVTSHNLVLPVRHQRALEVLGEQKGL